MFSSKRSVLKSRRSGSGKKKIVKHYDATEARLGEEIYISRKISQQTLYKTSFFLLDARSFI